MHLPPAHCAGILDSFRQRLEIDGELSLIFTALTSGNRSTAQHGMSADRGGSGVNTPLSCWAFLP